jgi:hypothetical protein
MYWATLITAQKRIHQAVWITNEILSQRKRDKWFYYEIKKAVRLTEWIQIVKNTKTAII